MKTGNSGEARPDISLECAGALIGGRAKVRSRLMSIRQRLPECVKWLRNESGVAVRAVQGLCLGHRIIFALHLINRSRGDYLQISQPPQAPSRLKAQIARFAKLCCGCLGGLRVVGGAESRNTRTFDAPPQGLI
jgi:hypothetical protein